ncbi:ATP-binding protein [Salininema proteolyticum]|uniref:ATP-binding protein n=1 Tax=Salininema proteolyticum TaxID=1607685 RepID=A0ABV8TZF2_9ACTN
MEFYNRTEELALLNDRIDSDEADLLVVYGRRRVGKTELLSHLAETRKSLYFEATDTVAAEQLNDLTRELALASGSDLLRSQPLGSWEAALAAIADYVGDERTLIVLDEFQYLAVQSPELETTLSRWWRIQGRKLPVTLVLAGSEISFFEDEVLAGQLYGRRTGQLKVQPFLAKEAALFHPGYSYEDKVRAYSVCGGIPYYLELFRGDRPLDETLLRSVFQRTGLLHDEAELMIRQSIADPTNYMAVLRSIAQGHNKNSSIRDRTGLEPSHITKILTVLIRLGLVERLRPITASPRVKKVAYTIKDQFLQFHFRFVEPGRSHLRTNKLAETYVRDKVLPELDHHASMAWEQISREHVMLTDPNVAAVGRWWGHVPTGRGRHVEEREIDVVAVDAEGAPIVLGMCKWTVNKVDFDELNLLDRLAGSVEGHTGEEQRILFSRSGFTDRVKAHAESDPKLRLVTPVDVYG